MRRETQRALPAFDDSLTGDFPISHKRRVLFVVEGFTDIRFVHGLSRICQLTMVVPEREYLASGLRSRIVDSQLPITVYSLAGGRLSFQLASLLYLYRNASKFEVILAQEALRGRAQRESGRCS
jgi:hypothetical protein